MSQEKRVTKRAIVASLLSLSICGSMLIGTTYAWFTDTVTSSGNIIKSGTLQVGLNWKDGDEAPDNTTVWKDAETDAIFGYDLWEPGYTQVRHLQVVNSGTLALKYRFTILPTGAIDPATADLAEVIDVYFKNPAVTVADRSEVETKLEKIGTLREILNDTSVLSVATEGHLAAGESAPTTNEVTIALKMQEGAGNEYQGLEVNQGFAVKLYATQDTVESDSFDKMYDEQAAYDHNDDDPAVTVKDDPTDVTIGIPAGVASPVDTYKVVVNDYETATNAEGTTTLSMDISLERNGIVVTDFDGTTEYSVKVFVGKGLMVDAVYHNELKVEPFTYDAVTGYISFTTTSFSPFSVVYHEPQTLTFDKNDANATGTMETQNIYAGVKAAISVNQFSKVGYTFTGWKDSEGNDYHDGEEYSFAGNTTLYAQWAPNDYPLQYWKNIAAGETVYIQTNFTFDKPFTVAACEDTRTGYNFVNWNTKADGSGDSYNAGETATISKDETVALYAQWQAKDYDVTFDANGGTGTMTAQTITFDATANLIANAFTKTGYTFAGWAKSADEPYTYEDKAPYTMETEGATLYAKWSANPYEVTFNANGGEGTMDAQTIYYDASADLTANTFTRTGYTFKGWNTKADGTGTSYADNASYTMTTEGTTLYAQWEKLYAYLAYDEATGTFKREEHTAKPLTSSSSISGNSDGWYVVEGEITFAKRVFFNGNCHLILSDGATMNANGCVMVARDSVLNIYGQENGTGKLIAKDALPSGYSGEGSAAIGGHAATSLPTGSINIYGGTIIATGASNAAGIGGGRGQAPKTINIYGGTVTAKGGSNAAGIGGGLNGGGGNVNIYGGTVTATGSYGAAGIGCGSGGANDGNVNIYGGTVTATGGNNVSGISGNLTVSSSLAVLGGSSANPTTEIASPYNSRPQYMVVKAKPPLYADKVVAVTNHSQRFMDSGVCNQTQGYLGQPLTFEQALALSTYLEATTGKKVVVAYGAIVRSNPGWSRIIFVKDGVSNDSYYMDVAIASATGSNYDFYYVPKQ